MVLPESRRLEQTWCARSDGRHWPSGRCEFSVPWARLHCEHDGEYRDTGICDGTSARALHRTLTNSALGVSSRGDIRRTNHGPTGAGSAIRFATQAFLLEDILLLAASLCAIGYRRDLLEHSFQAFALIALTALAMGTRNAAVRKLAIPDLTTTVLTLTITGIAADSSLAKGSNPRLVRRVSSVLAIFSGAGFGAVIIHFSVSIALAVAAGVSIVCSAALFRSLRTSEKFPRWARSDG
jgi:Protein of unknown function (DUF1275)